MIYSPEIPVGPKKKQKETAKNQIIKDKFFKNTYSPKL